MENPTLLQFWFNYLLAIITTAVRKFEFQDAAEVNARSIGIGGPTRGQQI